jgi:hypothetical protein
VNSRLCTPLIHHLQPHVISGFLWRFAAIRVRGILSRVLARGDDANAWCSRSQGLDSYTGSQHQAGFDLCSQGADWASRAKEYFMLRGATGDMGDSHEDVVLRLRCEIWPRTYFR